MNENVNEQAKPKIRHHKLWIWSASIAGGLLIAVGILAIWVARHVEPILRRRVIETLSARFHSPVELDEMHIVAANGLGVTGKGLRVMYIVKTNEAGRDRSEPMLSVGEFDFHLKFSGFLKSPTRIGEVHVSQLRVHLPPGNERAGHMLPPEKGQKVINSDGVKSKPTDEESKVSLLVDTIVVDDAAVVMETKKPGKVPLEFDIQRIVLKDVGRDQPFLFDAVLVNPKPVGDIHTTGHFGPWDADDPRQTPLDGSYTFENVDMNSIKGIGGHMSAHGNYGGHLEEITSDGETNMKDFSLDVSDHAMPLRTKYHAIIDGTSGDVLLQPVEAWLGNSYFVCAGHIVTTKDPKGHDIYLSVNMPKARIEDMLTLAVKTQPVLMRGGFRMKTELHIPPGDVPVSKKVELSQGTFTISDVVFSSEKIQTKVDTLSMRAQGKPGMANAQEADKIQSDITGKFSVGQSKIVIPDLLYTMPGAQVVAQGEYGMRGDLFEFHGKVRTKAKMSQMIASRWKSLLLKPVDPFFQKNGAGAEVPFKISGTKDEPHFGVEFHQDKDAVRDTSGMSKPK